MSPDRRPSRREFLSIVAASAAAARCDRSPGRTAPADMVFASAIDAARAIREGRVSSLELTQHLFDRIEHHHKALNVVVTLMRDEAMARAREADAARNRGETWGPLHGVPCTVKDAFEIRGVRTTVGSPALKDYVGERDARVVQRLRASGAVLLGMTNVPEMLRDYQSNNQVFGRSNNPWDPSRTPGGSTGGGAAAMAAGLGYLAIGSDIAGSLRVPAHFCGVYAHKPTYGVVPDDGHIPPLPKDRPSPPTGLQVIGALARSAQDLKLAMEVLGGPDADAAVAYKWTMPPPRKKKLSEYRLGYVIDDPFCPVASDVKSVLARMVDTLRNAGVTLLEGWPKAVDPADHWRTYMYLLFSTAATEIQDEQMPMMRKLAAQSDGSRDSVLGQAFSAPHKVFLQMQRRQLEARAAWREYFQDHDGFLMPTAFVAAFPHHANAGEKPLQTTDGERSYVDLEAWVAPATLAGLPATIAPVGLTEARLPVGVQILGPYLEDGTSIDIAAQMAGVVGGFVSPPGY